MDENEIAIFSRMMILPGLLMVGGFFVVVATILRGAVEKDPKNADAWVALGNALVGHAEGHLSPAALYAYRMGVQADPANPSPPMFLGLAMAREGRFDETRAMWQAVLDKAPADAPWRKNVEERVARLDKLMEMVRQRQSQEETGGMTAPAFAPR